MHAESFALPDPPPPTPPAPRSSFVQGVLDGVPGGIMLLLSFAVVGAASVEAGLTIPQAALMTLCTFAAPAQLVAVELMTASAGILQIVFAVAMVNLRFAFMAASLKRPLAQGARAKVFPALAMLTATTFALTTLKLESERPPVRPADYFLGIGLAALALSLMGTVLGTAVVTLFPGRLVQAVPVVTAVFLASRLAARKLTIKHGVALLGFLATPALKPWLGPYAFIVAALLLGLASVARPAKEVVRAQ